MNNKMLIMFVVILFSVLIFVSVTNIEIKPNQAEAIEDTDIIFTAGYVGRYYGEAKVSKIYDDNIVCYLYQVYRGGGISCLEIK